MMSFCGTICTISAQTVIRFCMVGAFFLLLFLGV